MATYGKGEFGGFSSYQTGDSPRTTGKKCLVKIMRIGEISSASQALDKQR